MGASDITVIGGGVIGLSIAWALAAERVSVTLLDSAAKGQASFAAAGMLAPLAEAAQQGEFVSLGIESLGLWPSFVDQLRAEVNSPLCISGPGMLRIARTDAEDAALRAAITWQSKYDLPLRLLESAELRSLEPPLSPNIRSAILSPRERCVDPRLLLIALREACLDRGVIIRSQTSVTDFETSGERITALKTTGGAISSGAYVLASGAWSRALAQSLGVNIPVHPLRGQMLSLGPLQPLPIHHTVYTHNGYLVPRCDGRIIAGTTEEQVDFDSQTTDSGIDTIHAMATSLIPDLKQVPRQSAWAGLRPVSADGMPIIGRLPNWENIYAATGHGRNGILLTPLTSRLLTANVLHNAPVPHILAPERFGDRI